MKKSTLESEKQSAPLKRPRVYREGVCIYCGCTDSRACPNGCSWVLLDKDKSLAAKAVHEAGDMKIPKTDSEANDLLRLKCEIRVELARHAANAQAVIDDVKARLAKVSGPLETEEKSIDAALETFFALRRKSLAPAKSLTLLFGRIGSRASSAVRRLRGWSEDRCVLAISTSRLDSERYLRVKTSLNKDAIGEAPDADRELLRNCGITVEEKDTFFIEPDLSALESQNATSK